VIKMVIDIIAWNCRNKKIQTLRFEDSDKKSCEQFLSLMQLDTTKEYNLKYLVIKYLMAYFKIRDKTNRKVVKALLYGCAMYCKETQSTITLEVV
jgi:hypothetical protein